MQVRAASTAILLAALTVGGAGCSVSIRLGSAADTSPTRVLTAGELKAGLIRLDEVGSDFRNDDPNRPDDPDSSLGCISDLGKVTKSPDNRPVRKADGAYVADSDFSYPQVFDTIRTFHTERDADRVMAGLVAALAKCHKVDRTNSHGLRIRLDVTTDQIPVGAEVTRQINVYASGHLSSSEFNIPMRAEYGLLQLRNQVMFLCFVNTADDVATEADAVVHLGLARLLAVLKHQPVPNGLELNLKVTNPDKVFTPSTQPGTST